MDSKLFAPLALVATLAVVCTVVQGIHTERWTDLTDSEELHAMAKRLEDTPLFFGEWQGTEQKADDDLLKQYERAKVNGWFNARFENVRTGKIVFVSLVVGHRRHVAIHTPDQCMVGAGFQKLEEERPESVVLPTGGEARVLTSQFLKVDPNVTQNQRILWCWSSDGKWIAPQMGRVELTGSPHWYKLYVTTVLPGQQRTSDISDSKEFLRQFLPVLNEALFPPQDEQPQDARDAARGA
jgi:hypothetical protein